MKKITTSKRKISMRDFGKWFLILLFQGLCFFSYSLLFLIFNHLANHAAIFPSVSDNNFWIFLIIIFTPIITTMIYILYSELGSPWTRFLMWILSLIYAIGMPTLIFIFL